MKTEKEFAMDLWRDMCGLKPLPEKKPASLKELRLTEWSLRFEQLMRNRILMGSFRYETWEEKRKAFKYAQLERMIKELKKYEKDGNDERLVNVANLCLLEFEFGKHPNKHFKSVDDGEHTRKL